MKKRLVWPVVVFAVAAAAIAVQSGSGGRAGDICLLVWQLPLEEIDHRRRGVMQTKLRTIGWSAWTLIFALLILLLAIMYLAY